MLEELHYYKNDNITLTKKINEIIDKLNSMPEQYFISKKEIEKSQLGEIRVTKTSKQILDVGLWMNHTMFARTNQGIISVYGGEFFNNWCHTGIRLTLDEWNKLTDNKDTEDICNELHIQYKFDTDRKKCLGCKHNTNIPNWLICEHCKHNYKSKYEEE